MIKRYFGTIYAHRQSGQRCDVKFCIMALDGFLLISFWVGGVIFPIAGSLTHIALFLAVLSFAIHVRTRSRAVRSIH